MTARLLRSTAPTSKRRALEAQENNSEDSACDGEVLKVDKMIFLFVIHNDLATTGMERCSGSSDLVF